MRGRHFSCQICHHGLEKGFHSRNPSSLLGLDYLEPIHVKLETELKKVWVCLAVRAVHLDRMDIEFDCNSTSQLC